MFIFHLLADPPRPNFVGERLFTTIAQGRSRFEREDVPKEAIRYIATFLKQNDYKAFSIKEDSTSQSRKIRVILRNPQDTREEAHFTIRFGYRKGPEWTNRRWRSNDRTLIECKYFHPSLGTSLWQEGSSETNEILAAADIKELFHAFLGHTKEKFYQWNELRQSVPLQTIRNNLATLQTTSSNGLQAKELM